MKLKRHFKTYYENDLPEIPFIPIHAHSTKTAFFRVPKTFELDVKLDLNQKCLFTFCENKEAPVDDNDEFLFSEDYTQSDCLDSYSHSWFCMDGCQHNIFVNFPIWCNLEVNGEVCFFMLHRSNIRETDGVDNNVFFSVKYAFVFNKNKTKEVETFNGVNSALKLVVEYNANSNVARLRHDRCVFLTNGYYDDSDSDDDY